MFSKAHRSICQNLSNKLLCTLRSKWLVRHIPIIAIIAIISIIDVGKVNAANRERASGVWPYGRRGQTKVGSPPWPRSEGGGAKMEDSRGATLQAYFAEVSDPREERTKLHLLLDIMVTAICAVICGAD